MGAIKEVRAKVQKGWSTTKAVVAYMCVWGLIFSLVTIGGLRAAIDYDDTLVFSGPAYAKAFASGAVPYSPAFWSVVNRNYDLEKPKIVANVIAWTLRVFGFRITILTSRPPDDGEPLKKEWRHLASKFVFAPGLGAKRAVLGQDTYVLYLADSDADIRDGKLAHVTAKYVVAWKRGKGGWQLYRDIWNDNPAR